MNLHAVLSGEDRSLAAHLLRAMLVPLALLHHVGLEVYLLPYALGIRKQYRLPVPVIVIGNLTSGGTGKTPMTVWVVRHLQSQGRRVVVLSRGHGSGGAGVRVVSETETAATVGDEPLLLAQSLPGVPVIVGKDRRISGKFAVETYAPDIIVLDDALQFWQLHRDCNIVLLDAQRPFDNGWMLPRGLLREPPSHLRRADVVVFTRATGAVLDVTRYTRPNTPILTATHAPVGWVQGGNVLPLDHLSGVTVHAVSGIANGAGFFETLRSLGVTLCATDAHGDHHAYSEDEITALRRSAVPVVTTEKDAVKLAPHWKPEDAPLYALRITMQVTDEERLWHSLSSVAH